MLRVLLIEDNRIFRETLKENLRNRFPFMVVEEAANCDQALQRTHEIIPHLIFMDMHLPEMNGLKLTQMIKKDFPDIYIAIITGYDQPEYRRAALQSGADRLFGKASLNWNDVATFIESIPLPAR